MIAENLHHPHWLCCPYHKEKGAMYLSCLSMENSIFATMWWRGNFWWWGLDNPRTDSSLVFWYRYVTSAEVERVAKDHQGYSISYIRVWHCLFRNQNGDDFECRVACSATFLIENKLRQCHGMSQQHHMSCRYRFGPKLSLDTVLDWIGRRRGVLGGHSWHLSYDWLWTVLTGCCVQTMYPNAAFSSSSRWIMALMLPALYDVTRLSSIIENCIMPLFVAISPSWDHAIN